MSSIAFKKLLSQNDIGLTGSHQAGIHIPKDEDLLKFLPALSKNSKNPDAWLDCIDSNDNSWRFRFIYYNNKLTTATGTRNEFRLTHTAKFFKYHDAKPGEEFCISKEENSSIYKVSIIRQIDSITKPLRVIKVNSWKKI